MFVRESTTAVILWLAVWLAATACASPDATGMSAGPKTLPDSTERSRSRPSAVPANETVNEGGAESGLVNTTPPRPPMFHTFPEVSLLPGEERLDLCESWTLNNDEELWVESVVESNTGGWHHSNWSILPENLVTAADGNWNCANGGYDAIVAAIAGSPFFNAATQSKRDVLEFAHGAAFRIPPHSRIVGQIHLLDMTDQPLETSLTFEVHTVQADQVRTKLQGLYMDITNLDIPAFSTREFAIDCLLPKSNFAIYYIMPHYHRFGRALTLEVRGGARDGTMIFDDGAVGTPVGTKLDPPFAMAGADGLRMACRYENTTANDIKWGFGSGEMCTIFGYVDGDSRLNANDIAGSATPLSSDGGVMQFTAGCSVLTH